MTHLYTEINVPVGQWLLEITYTGGDRQLVTAGNVDTLRDLRRTIELLADDLESAVILTTGKGKHE